VYQRFYAKVSYAIPSIGTVNAAFQSTTFDNNDPAGIGLSFKLTAIDNLALEFEANTKFPTELVNGDITTAQLVAGLGVGYTVSDFNVKFSFAGKFLGKTVDPDSGALKGKTPAEFAVGVMPSYTIGDLKVGLGFDMKIANLGMKEVDYGPVALQQTDSTVQWQASPQIQYTVGKGKLQTGVGLGNIKPTPGPVGAPTVNIIQWQIPVKLTYTF